MTDRRPIVIEIDENTFAALCRGQDVDLGTIEGRSTVPITLRIDAALVAQMGGGAVRAKNQRPKTNDQLKQAALT